MIQLYLALIFTLYVAIEFYWRQGVWWSAFVMPVVVWTTFVNSFHDASHFAMSKNIYVTNFWTYLWPWFSSPTTWDHQHVIAHHVHTNIHKLDPDLNHGMPLFRVNLRFRWRPWFHFQIFWTWFIWGVATLWLANIFDFLGIMSGKYHGVLPYQKLSKPRLVLHFFGRFVGLFMTMGIPFFLFPFGKAVWWGISFNFIFSICFMATTQVNHITPKCLAAAEKVNPSWAVHQVITAQAFAHESLFWWVFAGGLNFQIEHHLFPGINHGHLPALKPIVVRLCKKHGIPYAYCETYGELFAQHVDAIRQGSKNIRTYQTTD